VFASSAFKTTTIELYCRTGVELIICCVTVEKDFVYPQRGKGKTIAGVSSQFYHRNFIIAVLPSQFYHRSFIIVVLLPQSILSPQIHKHLRNGLIKNTLKIPSLKMLSATVHGIHQLVLLQ